ncbi:putative wall-associated receptor kinase, galacturonan-binding domain-containing protein [Helianthus anomalus]
MFLLFILFLFNSLSSDMATGNVAKPSCQTQCGNLTVAYPFGIGEGSGCSRDASFDLICNSTDYDPPKLFMDISGNIQVDNISDSEMWVTSYVAFRCYNQLVDVTPDEEYSAWFNLEGTPFSFSQRNKFTVIGCDDFAMITGSNGGDFTSGCLGLCTRPDDVPDGYCSGIECYQTTIPKGLKTYNATLSSIRNHTRVFSFNRCGYVFLGEEDNLQFHGLQDLSNSSKFYTNDPIVPTVLEWAIQSNLSCIEANECKGNSS